MKQILEFTYISNNTKKAYLVDDSVDLKTIGVTYSPEDSVHRRNFFICSTYAIPVTIQQTNLNTGAVTTTTGYIQTSATPTITNYLHSPCYWLSDTTYVNNTKDIMVSNVGYFDLLPSESIPYYKHGINYVSLYGNDELQKQYLRTHGGEVPTLAPFVNWKVYLSNKFMPQINITWDVENLDFNTLQYGRIHIEAYDTQQIVFSKVFDLGTINYLDIPYKSSYSNIASIVDKTFNPNLIAELLPTIIGVRVNFIYKLEDGEQASTSQMYFVCYKNNNRPSNIHGYVEGVEEDGSSLEIVMGYPQDDEDYQDLIDEKFSMKTPQGIIDENKQLSINGIGNLNYAITMAKVKDFTTWLWNSNFIDDIKLLNNTPIENVLSIKVFPFEIYNSTQSNIKLGNVESTVTGAVIPNAYNCVKTFAKTTVKIFYNNFLDIEYTNIYLYLPFIGIKEISAKTCMGKSLEVAYIYDIITGGCKAMIYIDDILTYEFEGAIGVEIPLTSNNRVAYEQAFITSAIGTVTSIATENYVGAIANLSAMASNQFHTSTSGKFTPSLEGFSPRDIVIIYDRPSYQDIDTFAHTYGRVCKLSLNLGTCKGFTQLNENIDLSGLDCDQAERDELVTLLTSGVYF